MVGTDHEGLVGHGKGFGFEIGRKKGRAQQLKE